MASQNDGGFRTFQASGAVSAFKAVKVQSDGTITTSLGPASIGVTQEDIADAGYGRVKLWSAPGTFQIQVSNSACTIGTGLGIITGGYAGTADVTYAPTCVIPLETAVASNGIVVEFGTFI